MGIFLKYMINEGVEEQVEIEKKITEIDLSNRAISSIDLSPLSNCKHLSVLNLGNNLLQTIDLTPLRSCKKLSVLDLTNNQLKSIDLSPLKNSSHLEGLYLYWNYLVKETVIPRFDEQEKGLEKDLEEDRLVVVPVDSTATEMTIKYSAKEIDFSNLSACRSLEEITIQECVNVESINLNSLNNSPTLRVIRVVRNGCYRLTLPSGCENLEEVIIIDNQLRRKTRPRDSELEKVTVGQGCNPVKIDGVVTVQRIEPKSSRQWKDEFALLQPKPIDLSVLDGSPKLRVLIARDSHAHVILPTKCPNLEAALLDNNTVEKWRLGDCPMIRLVTMSFRGIDIDLRTFLGQYKSPRTPPIIFVAYDFPEAGAGNFIVGFDSFPKRIQKRFVSWQTDRRWKEYCSLRREYDVGFVSGKVVGGIFDPYFGNW